jgi:hypothetical protein
MTMINEPQKCFFSYTVAKELEKELEKAINEGKDYFVVKTGYGSTKYDLRGKHGHRKQK